MTANAVKAGVIAAVAAALGVAYMIWPRGSEPSGSNARIAVDYEKYELPNGLDVILHVDRSDPLAAVAMTFHVGSAREVSGRTGFAHLFEHLFFLDSENLGYGGLDRLMTRVGSSTNGSTSRDRTNYFEVVPNDALEKTLWAEADKLRFFINTVTESVVAKERQVVKNEKRQRVDNQPYGHNEFVIDRALYPEGHPYRWQVIGELKDLDAASLADVKAFHERWYGPGNATLVVAGDIDVAQTKAWIEKYFGEIPARPAPEVPKPAPVLLAASSRIVHEDKLAQLPQLTLAWPTLPLYHPDSDALDALASLLADGKTTPFYEVIVKAEKLAPAVEIGNDSEELAGRFTLQIQAFPDKDLDAVMAAVDAAFARFEKESVPPDELQRVKAGAETAFYQGLSSALGKAFGLVQYNIFASSPGYLTEDLARTLAVTDADVRRAYETYIKGRPRVATSFVPAGQGQLALADSTRADIVEEPIVPGEGEFTGPERGETRTASVFDRSVEPPFGVAPKLRAPTVERETLANGLRVFAIEDREQPLVQFELRLKGGLLLDDPMRTGAANLLAETMTQGTEKKTPEELEQAIDLLGATIDVEADREGISISGQSLARNFPATVALVEEILLEPRWDAAEFDLAKQRVQNAIRDSQSNPAALAADAFARLVYGDHVLGRNRLGDVASIEALTLRELQAYYTRAFVPSVAAFHVAGDVNLDAIRNATKGIVSRWSGGDVTFPAPPVWSESRAGLFFIDVPRSAQSVVMIGKLALRQTDADFYPAAVMNFRLGGGGFASDLTQLLREQKGYTYRIRSGFSGSDLPGPFRIDSSVRSNVTLESLQLIKNTMERHGPDFVDDDLAATKSFLLKNNAMAFETLADKIGILRDISQFGFPADYVLQREAIVRDMTIDRVRELAKRYLDPRSMVWLVVGDAATQHDRLAALGLGAPLTIDREGRLIGGAGTNQPRAPPLISRRSPRLVDSVSLARFARLDRYAERQREQNSRSRPHNGLTSIRQKPRPFLVLRPLFFGRWSLVSWSAANDMAVRLRSLTVNRRFAGRTRDQGRSTRNARVRSTRSRPVASRPFVGAARSRG
jgi:zinc protease